MIAYGERRQPSYAWAFDRGDGLSNVGYGELLAGSGGRRSRPRGRCCSSSSSCCCRGRPTAAAAWRGHHLPLSGWTWRQPDGPVLLAGDAASLVNPMTGEGIYYAVATGIRAGRAAAAAVAAGTPAAAGASYRRDVRRLLARHLRHTTVASRLSRSPRWVGAGIRAAHRDPAVFDDLVEIGLGPRRDLGPTGGGLARGAVDGVRGRPCP